MKLTFRHNSMLNFIQVSFCFLLFLRLGLGLGLGSVIGLGLGSRASEVTTVWRYRNSIIIIII